MVKTEDIQALIDWIGHENIDPRIEIYDDAITGLSIRAKERCSPSSQLLTCPTTKSLSYINGLVARPGSPSFPPLFLAQLELDGAHIVGHFVLMQQYLLGAASAWFPYVRLLPQPASTGIASLPCLWNERNRKFLTGTNAGAGVVARRELWWQRFRRGREILEQTDWPWQEYTWELYAWAAAIFDSRSFQPAVTLSPDVVDVLDVAPEVKARLQRQVKRNDFSVLWPMLDLCNHNGVDALTWHAGSQAQGLTFSNDEEVAPNAQLWISYGRKSNSELLVAYGFMLPGSNFDTVAIGVKASDEALQCWSRRPCCANQGSKHADMANTITFNIAGIVSESSSGLGMLGALEHGLVELLSIMVANERERRFMDEHLDECLEGFMVIKQGPMSRNLLAVMLLIRAKLDQEAQRLHETGNQVQ